MLALNLAIEGLRWSWWKESEDKTSQLLSLVRESFRQRSVGSECGNPSTLKTLTQLYIVQDLGFVSQCINTVVWAEGRLNRIAGDRLHISYIRQLPHRGLYLLGDKSKQAQTSPLKEDFRQVPGQVTGQVFQTTWRQECYTSVQIAYQAKQSNISN